MRRTRVEQYYDRHARSYSPAGFSPNDWNNGLYFADQVIWHYLRKYAPSKRSSIILDAGAGTGDWALQFIKLGYKNMVLADISQGMLDEAKKRFGRFREKVSVRFVKSDITDLKELQSDMFDYVFSQYDAVSLSLKPVAAMQALARVAKKGAYVITSMDTKYAIVPWLIEKGKLNEAVKLLETGVAYEAWDEWEDDNYPSHPLTWEELAEYFEKAGLEVVEVVGAEVFTSHLSNKVLKRLKADPKARKILLNIEFEHCTIRSLVNMAGHLQMIGKKIST